MGDDRINALWDHAADLQNQVSRLNDELVTLAIASLALALGVMFLTWKLWHES